jgi:lipid II:glycine glycyltransferase (peptidoglycan interpeptide bridge formation enzyme)
MIDRDEYVRKMKEQLDQWNAEAAKWQAKAQDAKADMKAEYERQLQQYEARRDTALGELNRLQNASADAWTEMMRGTESAFRGMREAFDKARSKFEKK